MASTIWRPKASYLTGAEMVDFYAELVDKYPIISLEDGLGRG